MLIKKLYTILLCAGFLSLTVNAVPEPPSGSVVGSLVISESGIQGTANTTIQKPDNFSRSNNQRMEDIRQLQNTQRSRKAEHPFSELNKLSYTALIDLLVTIDAYSIPGLFTFSTDSYTFFGDQNRVMAIINAITDRGARFTASNDLGIPTLIEVLRAGFFQAFYNKQLDYLNNKKPFIQNILPAEESIVSNANCTFGTTAQDNVLKALGSLLGIGKTNKVVVLKLVSLMKTFNDNYATWVADYNKSTAWYNIANGVDYALVAVDLYTTPDATKHLCYNQIDAYWDQLAKTAQYGTYTNDNVWAINNAVWWTGRIGQFVVKPKQVNVLLSIIDKYGKWMPPSLEAVKVLDQYYKNDHPYNITQVKKEVHDKLLPNYYRFDNGKIIFNVGNAVTLEKVKTLYWAIKEDKAQFHRYAGRDEALEQGNPDDSLTAIVYNSPAEYTNNNFLYGLSTANGGMYIETWGTFFTYERTTQESIYSLEDLFRHEYTHFLQSRYLAPGMWGGTLWSNDRLTWLEEGGAEFTAGSSRKNGILYRKAMANNIASNSSERMTLPQVLTATYSSGFTFYTYACVFFSYIHTYRMDILNKLLAYVKSADAAGYDSYIGQLKSDAALASAYQNYMQQLVTNANSFVDPVTSPEYLADIPVGNLTTIQGDITSVTGMSSLSSTSESSTYYTVYSIKGTYSSTIPLTQLSSWNSMDSITDLWLDKLDDKSWSGYKTMTCYFTQYATSGSTWSYAVTFRGLLKKDGSVITTYPLTVTSGSGSGSYAQGTAVTVTANAPATGKVFDKWNGSISYLTDSAKATTTFTMPAAAAAIIATYKDVSVTTAPITPTNPLTKNITSTSATFTWDKISNATSYSIYVFLNGTWNTPVTVTTNSYAFTGGTPKSTIYWCVSANNSYGKSSYNNALTVKLLDGGVEIPAVPKNLVASAITTTSLTATWDASANATSYTMQKFVNSNWQNLGTATTTSYTITGNPGDTIWWRLCANNSAGSSVFTTFVSTILSKGTQTAPATPTNLLTKNITTTSATFTWDVVSNATAYTIQMYVNGAWKALGSVTTNSYVYTGKPGETIYWLVLATNNFGNSANSNWVTAKLLDGSVVSKPTVPTNLKLGSITTTTALIIWDKVTAATTYTVQAWLSNKWQTLGATATSSMTYTGRAGDSLWVRVCASNTAGSSAYSAWVAGKLKSSYFAPQNNPVGSNEKITFVYTGKEVASATVTLFDGLGTARYSQLFNNIVPGSSITLTPPSGQIMRGTYCAAFIVKENRGEGAVEKIMMGIK